MELPDQLAGHHVIGVDVGRRRGEVVGARRQAHDDQVLVDLARVVGLQRPHLGDVVGQAHPDVDLAAVAEAGDRIAGLRRDRGQHAVVHEQQPPVLAVLALPVVHAARAGPALQHLAPQLLARARLQRHQGVAVQDDVHRAVHDQRLEVIGRARAGLIAPGRLQLGDVAGVDLVVGRVLRGLGAEVRLPAVEIDGAGSRGGMGPGGQGQGQAEAGGGQEAGARAQALAP